MPCANGRARWALFGLGGVAPRFVRKEGLGPSVSGTRARFQPPPPLVITVLGGLSCRGTSRVMDKGPRLERYSVIRVML